MADFNIAEWSTEIFNIGTVSKADFVPPHFEDETIYGMYLLGLKTAAEQLVKKFTENFYDIYTVDFNVADDVKMEDNPAGVTILGSCLRYANKYGSMSEEAVRKFRIYFILDLINMLSDDTSNNIRSLSARPGGEAGVYNIAIKWCLLDVYCFFKLEDAEREGDTATAEKIKEIRAAYQAEEQELAQQQKVESSIGMDEFISACTKIDEAVELADSGKIDIAQQYQIFESLYTKEYSDKLREQGLIDRDIELAIWIIETAVYKLNMNIVECYNKCIGYIEFHPEDNVPIKLLSVLGLIQAIMADNLYRLIRDELCVRENIVTQFNDLVGYAYGNLQNYEGSMNADGVQEQMNDLNKKFNHAKAIIEFVRDGIQPVRPDTGEKLRFDLSPEQINHINTHPDEFDERMIALAKQQSSVVLLNNFVQEYFKYNENGKGAEYLESNPQNTEEFSRSFCKYVQANNGAPTDSKMCFTFLTVFMSYPTFLDRDNGFVPLDVFNYAVLTVYNNMQEDIRIKWLADIRNFAGSLHTNDMGAKIADGTYNPDEYSNWWYAYLYIEDLAKQDGWVWSGDDYAYIKEQQKQEGEARQLQSQKKAEDTQRFEAQKKAEQSRKWLSEGRCGACGGDIKGLFSKKCSRCGKPA